MKPLGSIADSMATWAGDWSTDPTLAWIYGIVHGWDGAWGEIKDKHKWSHATMDRLRALHLEYNRLQCAQTK